MHKVAYTQGVDRALTAYGLRKTAGTETIPTTALLPLVTPAASAALSGTSAPDGEGLRAALISGGGSLAGTVGGGVLGALGTEALLKNLMAGAPAAAADKSAWVARMLGGLAGSVAGGAAGGYLGHEVARHTSDAPPWAWGQP